jgi:NH3-dependent NAD+ synthetase
MAVYLGLDQQIIHREPTAGLEPGQSDFKDLGYDYDVVELVIEGLLQGLSAAELAGNEQVAHLAEQQMQVYQNIFGETKFQTVEHVVDDILKRHRMAKNKMQIVHPPTPKISLHYTD